MTDIHTHILPGVDDGAEDWEETRLLLQQEEQQGVCQIIATPHYSPDTDLQHLRDCWRQVQQEAARGNMELQISLGQEILYFEDLIETLEAGNALTLAESRYVLVEFYPGDEGRRLLRAVRRLVQAGYFPVIAHVERYRCLRARGWTNELLQAGAYLQINASDLLRGKFDRCAAWCRRELREGRIQFVASDTHSSRQRPPRMGEVKCYLEQTMGYELARRVLEENQQYILADMLL